MPKILELTDANLDTEVKKHKEPVMVVFHAPWCGHCRTQRPIVEQLADAMGNKAVFASVNIDDSQRKALEYSITGVPAFVVFKNGKAVEHKSGLRQLPELKATVEKYI